MAVIAFKRIVSLNSKTLVPFTGWGRPSADSSRQAVKDRPMRRETNSHLPPLRPFRDDRMDEKG